MFIQRAIKSAFIIVTLFVIGGISMLKAQTVNYAVHANIIYHFSKYIDWPLKNNSGPFIIGIINNPPLYEALKIATANKSVGNQKIVIQKFSATQSSYNCHILFIDEDESYRTAKIAAITDKQPILIVSEFEGALFDGSCINLMVVKERLQMEINKKNIEKRNLKIAAELLSLGRVIN